MSQEIKFHDRMLSLGLARVTESAALASAKLISKFTPSKICFFFIINLQNLGGLNKIKKDYEVKILLETEG